MKEARTKPWTMQEIKLLLDQVPKPINSKTYPPNPSVERERALIRAAREDGRYLDLNDVQRRIIDGRFPDGDSIPRSFYSLSQELGMSRSTVKSSYNRIISSLKSKK